MKTETNATENYLNGLRDAIEKMAGFKVSTVGDFDRLAALIFEPQHVSISSSTLKRLWGYAGQETRPRQYTLDLLARFVGYKNFDAYERSCGRKPMESQSQLFLSDALTTDVLETGARLLLTWLPDRRCVVEHQGNGRFRVVEAVNTKLSVGDTFECHLFINHEPLYIDRLMHNGLPPISYVAGRLDGITVRLLS